MSGRLLSGGARGPGVFFIIPCVDMYEKIDMRVQNFDVPPQEVSDCCMLHNFPLIIFQSHHFECLMAEFEFFRVECCNFLNLYGRYVLRYNSFLTIFSL